MACGDVEIQDEAGFEAACEVIEELLVRASQSPEDDKVHEALNRWGDAIVAYDRDHSGHWEWLSQ
jgi:hypothetical protein